MARILLAADDAVFSALVTDRLHQAGYDAVAVSGGPRAREVLAEIDWDLVIVDLDLEGCDAVEIVREVRANPETKQLPLLVIANHDEGERRLEALRAGADDALVRPCHFDEAVVRVSRLLGSQAGAGVSLQGDLSGSRLWDTLQYLERNGLSGTLLVRRLSFTGRFYLDKGALVAASFGTLSGREAALSMLGLKKGRFRFVVGAHGERLSEREPLSLDAMLLEAAVFEDELLRCGESRPATGERLRWSGKAPPATAEGLADEALQGVTRLLVTNPEITLYRLFRELPLAHQKIRLAVARLVEEGLVHRPLGAGRVPSTTDVEARHLTGVALYKLLRTSREVGFRSRVVPFVILADKGAWADCVGLLAAAGDPDEELARLGNRLRSEPGGTADFKIAGDRLALHFQNLSPGSLFRIEPLVSGCAGMLIWLDGIGDRKVVEHLVAGLDRSPNPATGILVTGSPAAARLTARLAGIGDRWRLSSQPPDNLLSLLRLLKPQMTSVG